MKFHELEKKVSKNGVHITKYRGFKPLGGFKPCTIEEVFNFSDGMTFKKSGAHKKKRSGGTKERTLSEIFANTFQGKLAEFAVVNVFYKEFQISLPKPDLTKYKLGKWDRFDFEYNGKKISVKSTKSYGNLLLLETKDWNQKGQYIPNISTGDALYDFTILIRLKPSCDDIIASLKFRDPNEPSAEEVKALQDKIMQVRWEFDAVGYITHNELVHVINNNHIINKGELLNGKSVMDATNYYVQAGDMNYINRLKDKLQ